MKRFNILGARKDYLFEFANLSRVWKFILPGRAHLSAARFCLTVQDGRSVLQATLFLVTVPTTRRALGIGGRWSSPSHVGCTRYPCSGHHRGSRRPLCSYLPPFSPPPHYSALHWLLLRSPSPAVDELPPSCLTRPKEAHCHCAPPAPRAFPQRRLATLSHRISPPSSSSASTSSVTTISVCSPTPPTPHRVPRHHGALPRPLLQPPRPLLQPLTGAASPSARASPHKPLPR
jgi:hypothetical protein